MSINARRKANTGVTRAARRRLRTIFRSDTDAGRMGRGACVHDLSFVHAVDPEFTVRVLAPCVEGDNVEGVNLRAVMTQFARLNDKTSIAFRAAIVKGVIESQATSVSAANVASKILLPVFRKIQNGEEFDDGFTTSDVRQVLSDTPDSIREGAAHCLRRWLYEFDDRTVAWQNILGPLFKAVWPAERRHKSARLTSEFAHLCVGSALAFPEALAMIKPYLKEFDEVWPSLHFLKKSDIPEKFPTETLELLWITCGPQARRQPNALGEILDRIVAAKRQLEIDRRLQWLEERAVRRF